MPVIACDCCVICWLGIDSWRKFGGYRALYRHVVVVLSMIVFAAAGMGSNIRECGIFWPQGSCIQQIDVMITCQEDAKRL